MPARAVRRERGVALVMTIFGLLLLTAVAVAMMYSSDSETMISVNYRDKQVSTYAALSGLQEARQRVHPIFGDLATANLIPTQTPTTANGQVLYILNPDPTKGETVASIAPWNPTIGGKPNPYFDQELCQENMMGLQPFLYKEGFTYHLIPFKPDTANHDQLGKTNTLVMYDNIMNKF